MQFLFDKASKMQWALQFGPMQETLNENSEARRRERWMIDKFRPIRYDTFMGD